MTDYTELKRLAEAAIEQESRWKAAGEPWPVWNICLLEMQAAANPAAVLALIAEVDGLHAQHGRDSGELRKLCAARDSARRQRDQLRAEVAGLKTGYEAYERVNAELKAEVEKLRKYGEEFAVLAERRREEADALRKDSESYRLLSFCHGQGTLELVRSHHELCAEIRRLKILAGEPVPPTPEEFIGPSPEGPTARIRRKLAARGKGEQS